MSKVLDIEGLCFSYEDEAVIRGLRLSLAEGELVALTGDNGTGKSTLMKLVLGQLRPDAGSLKLFGDSASENRHYEDIAYVSQDAVRGYKHFPTTIEELVAVHRRYLKAKADVRELMETVGLEGHAKKRLSQLSGGQLQRVGLLVALIKDARLILLDEPTTGVDRRFSAELYRILRKLADAGKGILVITHHLPEAAPFADRILRLEEGALVEQPGAARQGGAA